MPPQVVLWRIPENKLKNVTKVRGMNGQEVLIFQEKCHLMFPQGNQSICIYDIDIGVFTDKASISDSPPSVLGQDVLSRWRMRHDSPSNRLEFTAKSYDHMMRGSLAVVSAKFTGNS
jgi:hypothetical protein